MRAAQDPTQYLGAAKESGDVDYASAAVLFLDVEPQSDMAHRLAQVAVSKSRHGETGFAGARFFGATGRWERDASAVTALVDDKRVERRQADRDAKDEAKVMATVTRLHSIPWTPDKGSALKSKSALAESCGLQKARALVVISQLLACGKLVSTHPPHEARKVVDLPEPAVPQKSEPGITHAACGHLTCRPGEPCARRSPTVPA